jgi:hypothetical protein
MLTVLLKSRPIISGIAPVCGALIDMRDLGQILAHIRDAEFEVGEGPEPPPHRRVRPPNACTLAGGIGFAILAEALRCAATASAGTDEFRRARLLRLCFPDRLERS